MKKLKFFIGALAIVAVLGLNVTHAADGYNAELNAVLAETMSSTSTGGGTNHSCPSGRVLHEKSIEKSVSCTITEYIWASDAADVSFWVKLNIKLGLQADFLVPVSAQGTEIQCVYTGNKDVFCCQVLCVRNGSTGGTN